MWRWVVVMMVCSIGCAQERVSVAPDEDRAAVLHNPDMGWVVYENYPVDRDPHGTSTMLTCPGERFDGVDNAAVMFAWSDVEKSEGVYDFANVDRAYDYWRKMGKRIQLRLSAESLLWWNERSEPGGRGVPAYVLAKLPAEKKQVRTLEGMKYTVVDARDEYYRQRLTKFLDAVNRHFDAHRPVALVDLRGFGLWGEWHSGFKYGSLAARRDALCGIIDRWSKAFGTHWLALSYSWDPDGPAAFYAGPGMGFDGRFTNRYEDYVNYSAFGYAMTKPNVTLRRDGVGGAVHSNERKFCDEAFQTLTKGPMSCEFVQTYAQAKVRKRAWMNAMLDDALSLHPNYINVMGYEGKDALAFSKEQPEIFARGLREMGYRLVPVKVDWPANVRGGEGFEVNMEWVNRGVGRAMEDFHLVFVLMDAQGREVARCDVGPSGSDKWVLGKSYAISRRVEFKNLSAGKYWMRLGLRAGTAWIELPLKNGKKGLYPLAELRVED